MYSLILLLSVTYSGLLSGEGTGHTSIVKIDGYHSISECNSSGIDYQKNSKSYDAKTGTAIILPMYSCVKNPNNN